MNTKRRVLGRGHLKRLRTPQGYVYRGDWRDAKGRRVRRNLATDKRTAQRILDEIVRTRDLEAAGLRAELGQSVGLSDLKDRFISDLRTRGRSASHVQRTQYCVERLVSSLGAATVGDLSRDAVLAYTGQRVRDGRQNRTVNLEVNSLRAMLNFAVSAGIIAENPLSGLRSLPVGKRHTIRKRDFSREELAAFLREAKAVDQESGDKVGQYPLWLALAATGARWGETVALRWADVDTSRNELFFRGEAAKSGRDRRVPIPKTLLDELPALRRMHHDLLGRLPAGSDLVFLNPGAMPWTQRNRNDAQKRFRELLCRAAIERENERGRLTPHSLRHTFATHCASYGVPMAHCQQMLGHSTIALTAEIYTHVRTEALHLAVSRLPDPTQSDSRLGTRWALEATSSDSASEAAS